MNPYRVDLDRLGKMNIFGAFFHLASRFILIYATVWIILGSGLYLIYRLGGIS